VIKKKETNTRGLRNSTRDEASIPRLAQWEWNVSVWKILAGGWRATEKNHESKFWIERKLKADQEKSREKKIP
jgi:hypothetical protein